MKKIILALVAVSIAFYACKKDDKGSGTQVVAKPISTDSVQIVSDSLTVLNLKTTTKDSLPLSGSVVVLEQSSDTVYAINGGYVIIHPNVDEGLPQGYYLKVKGANTYFTIDLPIAPPPPRQSASKKMSIISRLQQAYPDSVIAFKLPLSLSAGVFTVQYEAYDANKNVSNVISVVVKVLSNDATTADYKALLGNWAAKVQFNQNDGVNGDSTFYGVDSTYANYNCVDNVLQQDETGTPRLQSVSTMMQTFAFNGKNRFEATFMGNLKDLDLEISHCDSLAYNIENNEDQDLLGGFYYDQTAKQVVIIIDNNGIASNSFSIVAFQVASVSANRLELFIPNGGPHIVFTK